MTELMARFSWQKALDGKRVARRLVALALVGAPLALGAAHPPVVIAVAALMWLAAVVAIRREPESLRAGPTLLAVALALLVCTVQLIPLPTGLFQVASPGAWEIYNLRPLPPPAAAPFSLDPPATKSDALELVALLAAAIAGAGVFGRRHLSTLIGTIAVAGSLVALIGFGHLVADVQQPFGSFGYRPDFFVSTFINPNHLAAFCGFASLVSLGGAVKQTGRRRLALYVASVITGACVFLSLSRGGMLSYVAALALVGALLLVNRRRERSPLVVQGALIGAVLVASFLIYDRIIQTLESLTDPGAFRKMDIWRPLGSIVADYPVLGVGRGAFGAVYWRYSELRTSVTFTHLENEWLQLVADFGPVVAVLIMGLLAWAALAALRHARSPRRLVLMGALLFVVLQNMADFSLALPSVAMPAVALLACLSMPRDGSAGWPPLSRRAAGAMAVGVAIAVPWLAHGALSHDLGRDTARLRAVLAEWGSASPQVEVILRRHPADFVLPLLVAEHEMRTTRGAQRAISWLNRSMYLAPEHPTPHRLAGRALLRMGHRDQGMMEHRTSCHIEPGSCRFIAAELLNLGYKPDHLLELRPNTAAARVDVARVLIRNQQPQLVLDLLGDDLETSLEPELAAKAHHALGHREAAKTLGQKLSVRGPERAFGYFAHAWALEREDPAAAIDILTTGLLRAHPRDLLLAQRGRLLLLAQRYPEARADANALINKAEKPAWIARGHWLLGAVHRATDHRAEALRDFAEASRLRPDDPHYVADLVTLRLQIGDPSGALKALDEAKSRGVEHPSLAVLRERAESAPAVAP